MLKLVFLDSAVEDLDWFRRYYEDVFPAGAERAYQRLKDVIEVLEFNPKAGKPNESVPSCRDFVVTGTPFVFVYRFSNDRVEVLYVKDGRAKR